MSVAVKGLTAFYLKHGRLPYYNCPVTAEGQEHIPSVVGPMGRSLASVIETTKATIDAEPWSLDPRCICLPWRSNMYDDMFSRPLTVGLILDDGVVRVHPPVDRALKFVAEKLKEHGHEVIPWNTSVHKDILNIQVRSTYPPLTVAVTFMPLHRSNTTL